MSIFAKQLLSLEQAHMNSSIIAVKCRGTQTLDAVLRVLNHLWILTRTAQ